MVSILINLVLLAISIDLSRIISIIKMDVGANENFIFLQMTESGGCGIMKYYI